MLVYSGHSGILRASAKYNCKVSKRALSVINSYYLNARPLKTQGMSLIGATKARSCNIDSYGFCHVTDISTSTALYANVERRTVC